MDTIRFTAAASNPICELAQRRLRESPYFFLKRLTCHFENGVITLRGEVPHFRLREFAEAIVARVDGVYAVNNQVEVNDPARRASA